MSVLTTADAIKVGTSAVDKVYIGSTQVWSSFTPFTPAALSPVFWLKADAITGLSNGAAVASWADSSGNGRDAVQATSGKRPTYQTNVVNGQPAVRFSTANATGLRAPIASALSGDNSHSWFLVAKPSSTVSYPVVLAYPADSNWDYILEYDNSGKMYVGFGPGPGNYTLFYSSFTTVAWTSAAAVKSDASTLRFWSHGTEITNKTLAGAGSGATPTMSGDVLIGGYADSGFGMQGDIAELLLLPDGVSDANRQKVEGYIAWKYGLTANLPSGHPYKSTAPGA